MKSVNLKNITILGELAHRLLRNTMRLESDIYQPDRVYQPADYSWPADWEGRALLAMVRQMEATHRESSYMREIFRGVYARFNERGYIGKILPDGVYDEQQLSGHNWLLRALLEFYNLTGDEEARAAAVRMIENLYLPLRDGAYGRYAIDPKERVFEGSYDGHITGALNGWHLSSDIGCAYMCLDALGMACRDLKVPGLEELLDDMVAHFVAIDFWTLSMQTHATLSATRGILSYYQATGRQDLLDAAIGLYTMYLEKGMSETYANHNWFNRPLWTEPCAIVDSYMVGMELFRATDDVKWLEAAQKIYFNAFGPAQRENGGFGCDNCVGEGKRVLRGEGDGTDAFWCCSMRGGEGLAEVAKSVVMEKDGVLHLALYSPALVRLPECTLDIRTTYPMEGHVEVRLTGRPQAGKIALYLPSYADEGVVTVDGNRQVCVAVDGFIPVEVAENSVVTLDFAIPLRKLPCESAFPEPGYGKLAHGFALLGVWGKDEVAVDTAALTYVGGGKYTAGEVELSLIGDNYKRSMADVASIGWQILFAE